MISTKKPEAVRGTFHDEEAVWLRADKYEAALIPRIGGNMVAFRDLEKGYKFLREPEEHQMVILRKAPMVFGIPVLFPPNRFEDGLFPWEGKTYHFPLNEVKNHNHIHGFLVDIPWEVEDLGATATESYVVMSVRFDAGQPGYEHFPFTFTFKIRYTLSENGLSQHFFIRNDGTEKMPCLLAFHTAFKVPYAPNSQPTDYRVKLTIGERWEMTERTLPTGKHQPLTAEDEALRDGGLYPFTMAMDNHYTVVPQNGRNFMELTDTKEGVTVVYDVGTSYKQWMIWNDENDVEKGFICAEPQTSLVNAPNMNLPADEMGMFGLEPGEIWEERARIYAIRKA